MQYMHRYPTDRIYNLRDLGGYACDGGVTAFGVFFRSDLPWHLTEKDRETILSLGIRASLDLRESDEAIPMRDELQDVPGIRYLQLGMKEVSKAAAHNYRGGINAFHKDFVWGDEYILMLERNHEWTADCFRFLAESEGGVLFHCFTGKDRTGILTMLVLGLCGVSREDIAADYAQSQIYLLPVYHWMRENIPDFMGQSLQCPFFSTDSRNILTVYDYVQEKYGGIEAFLRECGVNEQTLQKIREKLIKRA